MSLESLTQKFHECLRNLEAQLDHSTGEALHHVCVEVSTKREIDGVTPFEIRYESGFEGVLGNHNEDSDTWNAAAIIINGQRYEIN